VRRNPDRPLPVYNRLWAARSLGNAELRFPIRVARIAALLRHSAIEAAFSTTRRGVTASEVPSYSETTSKLVRTLASRSHESAGYAIGQMDIVHPFDGRTKCCAVQSDEGF